MPHRIYAKKRFGQNFLVDNNIIDKIIVAINPKPQENIIEIGPGLGALTAPILERSKQLMAIEIDYNAAEQVKLRCEALGKLTLIQQDALTVDFNQFSAPFRVIGNLPYNISTPLIFHLLKWINSITDMTFMLQKEVTERICAQPGSSAYGRLSVMTQYHCRASRLFDVPPTAFHPKPKVYSSIIRLTPHNTHSQTNHVNHYDYFTNIVSAAFQKRRKMLRGSLKSWVSPEQFARCEIDSTLRAEQLSVEDFVQLANNRDIP